MRKGQHVRPTPLGLVHYRENMKLDAKYPGRVHLRAIHEGSVALVLRCIPYRKKNSWALLMLLDESFHVWRARRKFWEVIEEDAQ
jgi:hypothetical protein